MAWTAPATWSVGETVVASKMNTHIRDNLNYLRGLAGAVNINNSLGIGTADFTPANLLHVHSTSVAAGKIKLSSAAPGFELQDHVADASRSMAGGLGFGTSGGHFGGGIGDMNFYTAAYTGSLSSAIRFSTARDAIGNYAERLFVQGGLATGAGRIGINQPAPEGALHVRNLISGALHWEYDGVDGTARTVIPNAAGDVLYVASGWYVARSSAATVQAGNIGAIAPGVSTNIGTWGGSDVLQFQVAANGAVTVQRTGGSLTYKVTLWVLWL